MSDVDPVDTTHLKEIDKLKTGKVWVLKDVPKDAFFTVGEIAWDWDGYPMAYGDKIRHPGIRPHDELKYAGGPGNWWGVVTHNGKNDGTPIEQSGVAPGQPYKHYMIARTKLSDRRYGERDIRHWTDPTQVPYVALPNSRESMRKMELRTGCYCLLVDMQTKRHCFAIFADSKKNKPKMGEISVRAAKMLGNTDGSGRVFMLVFPKTGEGQGTIPTEETIQTRGRRALNAYSWCDSGQHLLRALVGHAMLPHAIVRAGYSTNLKDLELI